MDNQSSTPPAPQQSSQPQSTSPAPVPYTPQTITEPPVQQQPQQSRSPMVTVAVFAGIILVGGFMAYNAVGSQLTKLAGQSTGPSSYSQIITATPGGATPTPLAAEPTATTTPLTPTVGPTTKPTP